jgi:3',5'-cyclic AMP phosphodiesterase CpdA
MLKLVQITDCHLLPDGERVFDTEPAARLAAAIADVNQHHADAALAVLTGDITHNGDAPSYAVLRRLLDTLQVPWQLVLGNHDSRTALRAAFPEVAADAAGFLQSFRDTPEGRLVFLDTVEDGVHAGAYCATRRAWLEGVLTEAGEQPVYVFLHHPPMPLAFPRIDQYRIGDRDAAALGDLLDRFPSVRHLFFGHVHRPISGSWRGIPFSTLRGTNHQNWLDLTAGRENISSLEPPAYAIVFIDRETTVVHTHDFLDASPRFVYDPDAPADRQVQRIMR